MPILDEMEEGEGAEHGEFAVREINNPHDAEQQRKAERDQNIDRAQPDTVDEHLTEDGGVEQGGPASFFVLVSQPCGGVERQGTNLALVTSLPSFTSAK